MQRTNDNTMESMNGEAEEGRQQSVRLSLLGLPCLSLPYIPNVCFGSESRVPRSYSDLLARLPRVCWLPQDKVAYYKLWML